MKSGIYRSFAILFTALLLNTGLFAAPLRYVPIKITQPDGNVINCFASGDEYYNWIHDKDGYTIIRDHKTGYFTYAVKENGRLIASVFIVGRDDDKRSLLKKNVIDDAQTIMQKRSDRLKKQSGLLQQKNNRPASGTNVQLNNIVIFVRFSDEPEFQESPSHFENMFNNSDLNSTSLNNYLRAISNGKLSANSTFFSFSDHNSILSYRDAHTRAYYQPYQASVNDSGYSEDNSYDRRIALLTNAIKSIQKKIPPQLNADGDGDGFVDNVCFIVSGNPTGWSSLLWPHMSYLPVDNQVTINGKLISLYNLQLENVTNTGVLAHEMLHTVGLPDLYHYSYDGISPVGPWDIMDQTLEFPQHPGIYMKTRYGHWTDNLKEIKKDGRYYLKPVSAPGAQGFIIKSPNSYKEYFVVEYRKRNDVFERYLPGEGLLLYRICPFAHGNAQAKKAEIPDEVYVFRPSGSPTHNGEVQNASLCAEKNATSIGDYQNPSCFLFNGGKTGIRIYNVGTCDDSIGFDVKITPNEYNKPVVLSPLPPEKIADNKIEMDIWKRNTKKFIKWSGFTGSNIKIEFSPDENGIWEPIAEKIPSIQGKYEWLVPATLSDKCRIRISDVDSSSINALSASFTIADWDRKDRLTFNYLTSAFAPDSERVFIGGINELLLYSSDAGNSWESRLISNAYYIKQIFCRQDTIWLLQLPSVINSVLLKSTDNGNSWQKIIIPSTYGVWKLVFTDGNIVYGLNYGAEMLKSTDGGNTWAKLFFQTADPVTNICFYNRNNGFALSSAVYRTTDGGSSWQEVKNLSQGLQRGFMDCCFADQNNGWISGQAYDGMTTFGFILKTSDGGNSWKEILMPGVSPFQKMQFANAMFGWALPYWDLNSIFQTTDGGESWKETSTGAGALELYDLAANGGKVFAVGENGLILYSEYDTQAVSRRADNSKRILSYELAQNFPNPFNPETQIKFTLKNEGRVKLKVYNLLGKEIAALIDKNLPAGEHKVIFNGRSLPSGFYFYQLQAGEFAEAKKMLLLK